MTGHVCPQCGARYEASNVSCMTRFEALLALDHSRTEPWGSRHGSAFAAYTLQHPVGQSTAALERAWTLLYRIWVAGDDPQRVVRALRRVSQGASLDLDVPPLPGGAALPRPCRVTIADLGEFGAAQYPRLLEDWCRATLEDLGIDSPDARSGR